MCIAQLYFILSVQFYEYIKFGKLYFPFFNLDIYFT